MTKPTARERLAEAAFALFDERGYEQTTVDDITERAGLGRTTFFRHYRSKEDVIFPDHDRLLEQIAERLRTSSHATALTAVSDAVRLVLLHYVDEGDLARRRYALTSRCRRCGTARSPASPATSGCSASSSPAGWPTPPDAGSAARRTDGRRPWSRRTTTCCAAGCAARAPTR